MQVTQQQISQIDFPAASLNKFEADLPAAKGSTNEATAVLPPNVSFLDRPSASANLEGIVVGL
jgi:hypothetical protein